jgi:hypothetical protein
LTQSGHQNLVDRHPDVFMFHGARDGRTDQL